jgi:hypothetical protein
MLFSCSEPKFDVSIASAVYIRCDLRHRSELRSTPLYWVIE